MNRSKLVAVTAALTLTLAACATDDTDAGEDTTTEQDAGAVEASGDLTGTVTDAQVAEDGSATLTVDTGDGTEELTASTAAYITTRSDAGGLQRSRLSTWLENNEFDGSTEYTFERFGGEVTDIRE